MPPAAMHQAMSAPNGPVAAAKVRGREKIPAPIIEPMTSAESEKRESRFVDGVVTASTSPVRLWPRKTSY
jgi:hypothetical protein